MSHNILPKITTLSSQGSNYTISSYNGLEEIYVVTPTANIVVNIPDASASKAGFKYQIKNLASSNTLTLTPSSCNIDGAATFVVATQYESVTLLSDGSNYHII